TQIPISRPEILVSSLREFISRPREFIAPHRASIAERGALIPRLRDFIAPVRRAIAQSREDVATQGIRGGRRRAEAVRTRFLIKSSNWFASVVRIPVVFEMALRGLFSEEPAARLLSLAYGDCSDGVSHTGIEQRIQLLVILEDAGAQAAFEDKPSLLKDAGRRGIILKRLSENHLEAKLPEGPTGELRNGL